MPRWMTVKFPMDLADRPSPDYQSGPVVTTPMTADDFARMEGYRMGHALPDDTLTAMRSRLDHGERARDIAEALGLDPAVVEAYRRRWFTASPPPPPPTPPDPGDGGWDPDDPATTLDIVAYADQLVRCHGCQERQPLRVLTVLRFPRPVEWGTHAEALTDVWIVLCPACRARLAS